MNHCNSEFNFDFYKKNKPDGNIEFKQELLVWPNRDLIQYYIKDKVPSHIMRSIIDKIHGNNIRNLIYYCFHKPKNLKIIIIEAIKVNNIEAIEIMIQFMDKYNCGLDYSNLLLKAVKYGNVKTFEHCLYAFMNYTNYSNHGNKSIKYQQMLDSCSDPEVLVILKKLEPITANGYLEDNMYEQTLRYNYCDDNNYNLELERKYKLYKQIFNN